MRIVLATLICIMIAFQLTTTLPTTTKKAARAEDLNDNEMTEGDENLPAAIRPHHRDFNQMIGTSSDYGPDADSAWDYDSESDYDWNQDERRSSNNRGGSEDRKFEDYSDEDGHYEDYIKRNYRSKLSRDSSDSSDCPSPSPSSSKCGSGCGTTSTGTTCNSGSSGTCNEESLKNVLSKGPPREKGLQIAQKAAQEAKTANDAQLQAGKEAAHQVRAELAEKALQAAKAAEADLAGKQQVLEQLQNEHNEAEVVIKEEECSQRTCVANLEAIRQAAKYATDQYKALSAVLKCSIGNEENLDKVRSGAEQELDQKKQLLEAAKTRVIMLHKQLKAAIADLDKTKLAAYRAACAAVEAQQKAMQTEMELH